MEKLLKQLLGASAMTLAVGAFAGPALAQATDNVERVTVTSSASRIDLKGFEAPTPVTVIGLDTLNRDAKVDLGDEIRELPQIRGGQSITTGSNPGGLAKVNAGLDSVDIRGLGPQRNLVLFDHQRVVAASIQDGFVDTALIPSGLVERVDVVTGGASAAWGSDAVTGVVNIVINKTYEGFKGSATYSNSTEVPDPIYRASFAWGTSFLSGKAHTVFGADFTRQDTAVFPGDAQARNGNNGKGFVYNSGYCKAITYPAGKTTGGTCSSLTGQPYLVYAYGLGATNLVVGGLTSANSAGAAGSPIGSNTSYLKGTMFAGTDNTPTQFNYGTVYNINTCYNGCTNNQFGTGGWAPINPYHEATYFSYTSYQLTPDIKASVQLNYARQTLRAYGNTLSGTNQKIYADNAYLPDSVAQSFVCAGGTIGNGTCNSNLSNGYNPYTHQYDTGTLTVAQRQSTPSQFLTMGFEFSGNRANPSPSSINPKGSIDYNFDNFCAALNQNCGWYGKQLMRGVFTLEGSLGDAWTWNGYIEGSQIRLLETVMNPITLRVANALDAVRVTAANVGTSGLPIGSIQCRGLLNLSQAQQTNADQQAYGYTAAEEIAGCVPFDPFGTGAASNATRLYVNPGLNGTSGELDVALVRMTQVEGSVEVQGVLPWRLPAGDVAISLGAEWRLEQSGQLVENNRAKVGMYPSGNFGGDLFAHLHSEEGFVEVAAPILKNTLVNSLDFDLAGRMTNYSFSGLVETWKLGVTSQLVDDLKFRATWSYDIRAPDNWDLYGPGALAGKTCPSFIVGSAGSNGGKSNSCFSIAGGNPNLQPEKSTTFAVGLVATPSFLPGFTASVDWYQIHLHSALTTPTYDTVISRCQTGETVYCAQLVFDRQGSFTAASGCGSAGANGACLGADTTSQIDFVHISPVNAAMLSAAGFDFVATYGFDLFAGQVDVNFNGNYQYDFAQTLNGVYFQGAGGGGNSYYSGGPKFQGTLNVNYRQGAWSFGTQVRIIGDSVMDLGTENNPAIACQGVTYSLVGGVDVAQVGSGQRCGNAAQTNYNAVVAATDLRASYRWNNNFTLFTAVDNVQDLPTSGGLMRRTYRAGFRWNL